jgi:hypothetical protein
MTGRTKVPEDAAIGVFAHSGWAAYVVLSGSPRAPEIVARGRMHLCDDTIPGAKQPYHEAEPMAFALAAKFIARCAAATAKLAAGEIATIEARTKLNWCCVLTASGRPLPDLKSILASHSTIHAAEGEFYRDAVAKACAERGIAVRRVRQRDMEAELQTLPVPASAAKERLAAFGKQVGSPWTQDEKLSASGAWLMLASRPSRRKAG